MKITKEEREQIRNTLKNAIDELCVRLAIKELDKED